MVGRPSRSSKSGQETFPEVQKWLGDLPGGLEVVRDPPGRPEVVRRPSRRSGSGWKHSRRYGSGRETLS